MIEKIHKAQVALVISNTYSVGLNEFSKYISALNKEYRKIFKEYGYSDVELLVQVRKSSLIVDILTFVQEKVLPMYPEFHTQKSIFLFEATRLLCKRIDKVLKWDEKAMEERKNEDIPSKDILKVLESNTGNLENVTLAVFQVQGDLNIGGDYKIAEYGKNDALLYAKNVELMEKTNLDLVNQKHIEHRFEKQKMKWISSIDEHESTKIDQAIIKEYSNKKKIVICSPELKEKMLKNPKINPYTTVFIVSGIAHYGKDECLQYYTITELHNYEVDKE